MCVCFKATSIRISLAAEATGNTNLLHGTPHRLILVVDGMMRMWMLVRSLAAGLPLLQVIRRIRIRVVQVFLATGTGQELPPVSFELGAARKGGALRWGGSGRRVVVMSRQGGGESTGSSGGNGRDGRQLRRQLLR